MGKHSRPSRLVTLYRVSNRSPLRLSLAAGVAGTVAVTGTVVASASDGTPTERIAKRPDNSARFASVALAARGDLEHSATALRTAVADERAERAERLAKAKARAIAKRKAAKRAAARAAAERAAQARELQERASRSVERMSASAAHVLQIAAAVASGAYYAHGGAGPSGFDCSGFTSYVFSQVGVSLPHSSSAQAGAVQRVSNPQPGDLVFVYNGGGGSIGHVAIYAGGGYWWEAANPSTGVGKHRAWSSAVSYGRVL